MAERCGLGGGKLFSIGSIEKGKESEKKVAGYGLQSHTPRPIFFS